MNKKLKYLSLGFFILVFLNVLMLLKFPIYPDEINWLVNITRYNLDQGRIYHYMKPCFGGFIDVPFYLKSQLSILGLYSSISEGFFFRAIPLIITLITISLFSLGVYKSSNSLKSTIISSIILCIAVFGSAGSIWNSTIRAENLFSLYIVVIFLFISYIKDIKFFYKNFILLILIYIWTILSIAHPKGLYFLLIIYVLIALIYKNKYTVISLFLLLGFLAYLISIFDYDLYINCKNIPEFNRWMSSMNINPLMVITNPTEFSNTFFSTIGAHLNNLLTRAPDNLSYLVNPSIGLLPSVPSSFKVSLVNFFIKVFFIGNLILSITLFLKCIRSSFGGRKVNSELFFYLISIYLVLLIIITFNRTTNNYDIQFWNINLTIANLIFLSIINKKIDTFGEKYLLIAFFYLCLTTHIFHNYYYKVFKSDWNLSAHAGPNAPLRYFKYDAQKRILDDFNSNCIQDMNPDLILFDDRTYIPLNKFTGRIAPFTYTALPYYNNNSLENGKVQLSHFLSRYNSVIMYGSCGFQSELPSNFVLKHKFEDYSLCCYRFVKNTE